jgi:hypothetical protein
MTGGSGSTSGYVHIGGTSGPIVVGKPLGQGVNVSGVTSIQAGAGANSGELIVAAANQILVHGSIVGSTGSAAGGILVNGVLGKLTIDGDIRGGESVASGTELSGFVAASSIGSVAVGGNVTAGTDYGGGITDSGYINATGSIGSLTIKGSLGQTTTNSAVPNQPKALISVGGTITGMALKNIEIDGGVTGGQIIAGISKTTSGTTEYSAGAQIGSVLILGPATGLNIAAGADSGTDGLYGTSDDKSLVVTHPGAAPQKTYSAITSVVIQDAVNSSASIEAQNVVSVLVGTNAVPLKTGPGNDLNPQSVGNVTVFELVI